MRIAFVTPYGAEYENIHKHTSERLDHWRSMGADVAHLTVRIDSRRLRSPTSNLARDLLATTRLVERVRRHAPDLVVLRWLTPVPFLNPRLARIAPLVLEVHANDLVEVARGRGLRRAFLQTFRKRELASASSGCFVISELANDAAFSAVKGERDVFPNGTNLRRRTEEEMAERLTVGMAVGQDHAWQGLDRFSALAEALPHIDFVVVCPGRVRGNVQAAISGSVRVVATTSADHYRREVASWTAAMGTLALERSGRTTAAPLKVRDYLGLGVPSILPYWDEALGDVEDPLVWKVAEGPSIEPSIVQPCDLSAFVDSARGRSVHPSTSEAVTAQAIERRRMDLFRRVVSRAEHGGTAGPLGTAQ